MVLVFMDTAAGRGDNDTVDAAAPPSGATDQRPVVRLWIHGVCFLVYLLVKAIQLPMPDRWYPFNRYMDEISLAFGIISLAALICSITYEFVVFAVAPVVVILFAVRLWWGDSFYEWLYLVSIRIYKGFAFLGNLFLYLALLVWIFFSEPHAGYQSVQDQQERQQSIANAGNAIEASTTYWSHELRLANLRRDAAAQVAREIADDKLAAHNAGLTYAQALIDAKANVGYIPRPAALPADPQNADPRDVPAVPAPQP